VTFVPPSSIASGVVSGTVAVSNFPALQPVSGPLTDAQLAARLPLSVTGPLTDAQLAARLPFGVTGPLTDAQLAARLPLAIAGAVTGPLTDAELAARLPLTVDGSGVTQPISVDELPLPDGAADNKTLSEIALAAILEREKLT